jgi:hypothetical protein
MPVFQTFILLYVYVSCPIKFETIGAAHLKQSAKDSQKRGRQPFSWRHPRSGTPTLVGITHVSQQRQDCWHASGAVATNACQSSLMPQATGFLAQPGLAVIVAVYAHTPRRSYRPAWQAVWEWADGSCAANASSTSPSPTSRSRPWVAPPHPPHP